MAKKDKSNSQVTEFLFPKLDGKKSSDPAGKMGATSKLVMIGLLLSALFVGSILIKQKDISYKSRLFDSLNSLTNVKEGKVTVTASQTGLDASVVTSFKAEPNKPQKTQVRLDYLDAGEVDRDIQLLDVFKDPYAELPLSSERVWVSVKTEDDIKSLENLGFPVEALVKENANTPLLPFGSFTEDQSVLVKNALKDALNDAEFIRADQGILEYQAVVTKNEAYKIVESTKSTGEPMSKSQVDELFQDDTPVTLTIKVDRVSSKVVEAELSAVVDNENVKAVYQFDYSEVDFPKNPPKSISASKFINQYLKAIRNN